MATKILAESVLDTFDAKSNDTFVQKIQTLQKRRKVFEQTTFISVWPAKPAFN